MERYSVLSPPIKSAHSEYRDQWIGIMSIQHNSSQLWKNNFKLVLYIFGNLSLKGKHFWTI